MAVIEQRASAGQTTECRHQPLCPPANATGRLAAVVIAAHPEQGWSLLCNGLITFDDTGAIAEEQVIPPQRATACSYPSCGCTPKIALPKWRWPSPVQANSAPSRKQEE